MHNARSLLRARPWLYFAICTGVAVGVWLLPFLREPNGNMAILPSAVMWLSLGLVAGMLVPERPWRWAVAMILGNPVLGLVGSMLHQRLLESLPMLALTLPMLGLMAAPIAGAAYLGRFLVVGRTPIRPEALRSRRVQTTAFLASTVLCAAALITTPGWWSLGSLAFVTVVCGGYFSARSVVSMWRIAGLCTAGALGGYIGLVAYDLSRSGPNHNMMPFEIWLMVGASAPAAVFSTWLGSVWRQRRSPSRAA